MMKKGFVYKKDVCVGTVWEDGKGYGFQYDKIYLDAPKYGMVSRTLPLRPEPFIEKTMIPFFDGLIPEGWLLEIAVDNWKLNAKDRMGLLLALCEDCIGDIGIRKEKK